MKKILISNTVLLIAFYLFTAFKKNEHKVILSNNKLHSEQDKKVDDLVKSYMQNDSTVMMVAQVGSEALFIFSLQRKPRWFCWQTAQTTR